MSSDMTVAGPVGPKSSAGVRLGVMMFLQYAVWGVWLPLLSRYLGAPVEGGGLGFTGMQVGWILGLAGSIGAVTGPFIAGQVADRYMNAERALAVLLFLGGIVQYVLSTQTSYGAWLALSICYSVLYMPTLALTNSIAFANLDDPEKKFPPVRSLGTIGWIVASVAFPVLWMSRPETVGLLKSWPFIGGEPSADATARIATALKVSGVASVLYAVYSVLLLPKTPPKKVVQHPLAFAEAFSLFKRLDFTVLTLAALMISMIHNCYFIRTGPYLVEAVGFTDDKIGPVMAIGQVSEIVVLAVLGLFLKRLGYKWVLTLGALSFALRYGLFAFVLSADVPSKGIVQAAMALHGLNYGFFFAGSFLFVEKVAPQHIRHSAQTVFGIIILGAGPVLAGLYNGTFDRFKDEAGGQRYDVFWWTQAGIALLATLVLLTLLSAGREPRRGE